MYLGEWQIDDLLTFSVTTHTFATGNLTDADSVPSYRVYEDETGTAILTGNMAKLDDANTTGHYSEQITLSAANGFEEGKTYTVHITATVASVTGGANRTFQVEPAKATAAAVAAVPTANDNADALLKRDWTAVSGEAARSVLNALRFLRNKWSVSSGTLTVTEEDDTTTAWTADVTGTAGADPITTVDPA